MTVFAAAVDVLFTDPNMSVEAIYTPAAGSPVTVRAIWSRPDDSWSALGAGVTSPKRICDIRMSELADAAEGDTVEIGGETFTVDGEPRRDSDRLVWRLGLKD